MIPDPDDLKPFVLPIEVEIFLNKDGSVTFADLEKGTARLIEDLNPDQDLDMAGQGNEAQND